MRCLMTGDGISTWSWWDVECRGCHTVERVHQRIAGYGGACSGGSCGRGVVFAVSRIASGVFFDEFVGAEVDGVSRACTSLSAVVLLDQTLSR